MVHGLIADLTACPDVVVGVVEVAGIRVLPGAAAPVAREDPVCGSGRLVLEEGARGRQIGPEEAPSSDFPGVRPSVPPDAVAGVTGPTEEVAGGQVLDPYASGLPDHEPVEACRAILRL